MPRRRTVRSAAAPRRGDRHGRHGRIGRSEVVRPPLAPLEGRIDRFDLIVGMAVEFLRGSWAELEHVRFEIGAMPAFESGGEVPRWHLDRDTRRIVLFRLPIERMLPPGHDDAAHRRIAIESAVFRAAAEYVGREPWDLGHEH
ncbi:MAG: hypothetical protein QM630_03855 [Microbacterium sp.]